MRSRICSQDPSRTSGRRPWPQNVALRRRNPRFCRRCLTTLRSPSSISARTVVCSDAARRLAARRRGSEISTVVFIHTNVSLNPYLLLRCARTSRTQASSRGIKAGCLVRMRGLEPPLPEGNMDLNHARLPIPPHPHGGRLHFYSLSLPKGCQTGGSEAIRAGATRALAASPSLPVAQPPPRAFSSCRRSGLPRSSPSPVRGPGRETDSR